MRTLITIAAFCTGIMLIISCILAVALNRDVYDAAYTHLGTAEKLGMSQTDQMAATDALLEYCKGNRDDIQCEVTVDGEVREAFDARETAHMVDVKNLAQGARTLRNILILPFAGLLVFAFFTRQKRRVCKFTLWGLGISVGFVGLLGLLIASDFSWFWTTFHHVFFTNDLWLLDPSVSLMINMFPLQFFLSMCVRILILIGICFAIAVLVCVAGLLWSRKKGDVKNA